MIISIHAPRTGSDDEQSGTLLSPLPFQSTLPARGATVSLQPSGSPHLFQSTLPARGATAGLPHLVSCPADFNPRSPHGERLGHVELALAVGHFNPRSPHGERRQWQGTVGELQAISIHAPRTGSDRRILMRTLFFWNFNPRSPHGERLRKVTILSIRIIGFAQKVYHKTVLLRISLAENAVILPEKPRNPVRTSLQKAGGLRFARAIRAARPYSISSPSGA